MHAMDELLLLTGKEVLQGGVVAAFGLVRGSAQADMLQLSAGSPFGTDTLAQVRYSASLSGFV